MNLEDTYQETLGQLTPEPLPVKISAEVCPVHNFHLVSVPRDAGTGEKVYYKCPLKSCPWV